MRSSIDRSELISTKQTENDGWFCEYIVVCPQCKAIQTIWIERDIMIPTRKFVQKEGQIYHDCGTDQKCRIYPTSK